MSTSILVYIIESSIAFTILFVLYQLFFASYKNLQFNRIFLIFTGAFSLLLPFVRIPLNLFESQRDQLINNVILLPTAIIQSTSEELTRSTAFDFSTIELLGFIYFSIAAILLIKLILSIGKVVSFIWKNRKTGIVKKDYLLIPTNGKINTCSFFHFLLWDNTQQLDDHEKRCILDHEYVHIKQKHSLDVVGSELLSILFWFNPLIYLYKKSVKATHEFIADDYATHGQDKKDYISILSTHTLKKLNLSLGNNFYQTQILKRLNMLKTEKKRSRWSRMMLTVPILGMLIYVLACESRDMDGGNVNVPDGFSWIDPKTAPDKLQEEFENEDPEKMGILFFQGEMDESVSRFMSSVNPKIVEVMKNDDQTEIYLIVDKELKQSSQTVDDALTFVDEMPVPTEGFEAFYHYIAKNMKYPTQARQNNIQGKVFVEFTVTEDGNVENTHVKKGIGLGCDEEALRVVSSYQNWKPGYLNGKAVKTSMIIPVSFKLADVEPSEKNIEMKMESKNKDKALEEIVVISEAKE